MIMFYWPNPLEECKALEKMKPNWIYKICNFKGRRYGFVSPVQIQVGKDTVIEPMPSHLDIRLPFIPRPDKVFQDTKYIDAIAKVLRVIPGTENNCFQLVMKDCLKEEDNNLRLICKYARPDEDEQKANEYIGKNVLIRNAINPILHANTKVGISFEKDFVAIRLQKP